MRKLLLALLPGFVLAGCVADAPQDAPAAADDLSPTADAWAGADRVLVAERGVSSSAVEADVLCATGGDVPLERLAPVPAGATRLEISVALAPGRALTEVGWALDEEPASWAQAPPGASSFVVSVPLAPDQWEDGAERWTFRQRMNLPGPLAQGCYTGAGVGEYAMKVEAVRDAASA